MPVAAVRLFEPRTTATGSHEDEQWRKLEAWRGGGGSMALEPFKARREDERRCSPARAATPPDLNFPGQLYACFAFGHARTQRFVRLKPSGRERVRGWRRVFTGEDTKHSGAAAAGEVPDQVPHRDILARERVALCRKEIALVSPPRPPPPRDAAEKIELELETSAVVWTLPLRSAGRGPLHDDVPAISPRPRVRRRKRGGRGRRWRAAHVTRLELDSTRVVGHADGARRPASRRTTRRAKATTCTRARRACR